MCHEGWQIPATDPVASLASTHLARAQETFGEPHSTVADVNLQPVAIVLQFMHPAGTARGAALKP